MNPQGKMFVQGVEERLVAGARVYLKDLEGQFVASFIDGEGADFSSGKRALAGTIEIFSVTPSEVRFQVEGNEFGTTSVDGYYSATRCD